ncbi:GspH/FimT family pseudopilin [Halomonas heilongjiangensis]|nr:GspH/FimT family pseudopilin [Halomonas heilongjiangensis]
MKPRGFTLIELLVTLSVAVILATIAVPGFQGMMATNRLSADHNEILAGLNFARSEAAKRRESVVFAITSESPWEYRVYPADSTSDVMRRRVARDDRTAVTSGSVAFNPLGRRDNCTGWTGCTLAVSWGGGDRVSGIEIGLTGRVSKTDTIPD